MTELIKGILRGMGCVADCELIATGTDSHAKFSPFYSRCAVVQAPDDLPDGYYEVTFNGHSAFLHRLNGTWSPGVAWHELPRAS
jgi:hypothetical protein